MIYPNENRVNYNHTLPKAFHKSFRNITALIVLSFLVFLGIMSPSTNTTLGVFHESNHITFKGSSNLDFAGSAISEIGDVNNDGFDDLLRGSCGANSGNGMVFLIFGRSDEKWVIDQDLSLDANVTFIGAPNSNAGVSLSGIGDVNNDTYADFLIGAAAYNNGSDTYAGKVYLIMGKSISKWQSTI